MKTTQLTDGQIEFLKKTYSLVAYKLFGKTYLRKAIRLKPLKEYPATNADCLKKADQFAKAVIADPEQKKLYEAKAAGNCSAYNKAVAEYMLTH